MEAEEKKQELKERLELIEQMMAEGRQTTESWGWVFVLWGVAYYVAIGWATWNHSWLAWPVTMTAGGMLTGAIASRMQRGQPETTMGRAVGAVWIGMAISISVTLFCLSWGGRTSLFVSTAVFSAMLGMANIISATILRWKAQYFCAAVWLASTIVACFASERVTAIVFLSATFLGQIAFGIYAMICERQRRNRASGAIHG